MSADKLKTRFILRSGERFDVAADEATIKVNAAGDLVSWMFQGATHPRPLYIRPEDVSAVLDMGPAE